MAVTGGWKSEGKAYGSAVMVVFLSILIGVPVAGEATTCKGDSVGELPLSSWFGVWCDCCRSLEGPVLFAQVSFCLQSGAQQGQAGKGGQLKPLAEGMHLGERG